MHNEKPVRNTFHKGERLCSKKIIDEIFASGKSFLIYPYKVLYLPSSPIVNSPVQIAFGVSKRYDKRAVYRNLIKRRMREAYRKNKNVLYKSCNTTRKGLSIFVSFVGKEEIEYSVIEEKFIQVITRLIKMNEEGN